MLVWDLISSYSLTSRPMRSKFESGACFLWVLFFAGVAYSSVLATA